MDYTADTTRTVIYERPHEIADGRIIYRTHRRVITTRAALDRFLALVDKNGPGGCWLWTGHVDAKSGYAKWRMPGEKHASQASRAAYRMLVGPIPEGKHLDHLCRVTRCVNPEHLEPVTPQINTDRSLKRKQDFCGRGHAMTGANVGLRSDGKRRYCKACSRVRSLTYYRGGA